MTYRRKSVAVVTREISKNGKDWEATNFLIVFENVEDADEYVSYLQKHHNEELPHYRYTLKLAKYCKNLN